MGVMLSVLVASVGAMDLIYCLAFASNQLTDEPANDTATAVGGIDGGLEQYQNALQQQIDGAQRSAVEGVTYAQDGVPYHDGYRVEQHDEVRLDALMVKLRELERKSQEKDERLEQMGTQMGELERTSVEQTHIIDELRSRPMSRAPSAEPESVGNRGGSTRATERHGDLLTVEAVPQIVLNEPTDLGAGAVGGDEPRPSSSKFRPIRRDSELRKSVKRRSVTSNASQDDRLEELEMLSRMEAEEASRVDDDYTVIEYTRNDFLAGGDALNRRHQISPIHELCHLHEDDDGRPWCPERSPEPTMAANITKPWGDIRMDELKKKEKAVTRLSRSMSIEEEEGLRAGDHDEAHAGGSGGGRSSGGGSPLPIVVEREPRQQASPVVVEEAVQRSVGLHLSESAPSNLSSHSNTPEREHNTTGTPGEPTLRRTTKEANLPGLLQANTAAPPAEERKASRGNWATEIIINTETESSDSDSPGHTTTTTTQFMQSKSPSPYPTSASDHHPPGSSPSIPDISNRLVPLLLSTTTTTTLSSPEPYPVRPRSPTPYDEPGSSRESTPSPVLTNGSVSRDNSISPSIAHELTPRIDVRRKSRSPGGVLAAKGRDPIPTAHLASPAGSMSPQVVSLEIDAGTEGDTECEEERSLKLTARRRSKSPRSKSSLAGDPPGGPSASLAPRRKYKERKRLARSLTPIDFDQTFMDSFSEQHLSVTPSEMEDYINSMEEINFVPPEPTWPSYLYPMKARERGEIPSLTLTDAQGGDAQFHDELSSKGFYGASERHEGITLNHRVSYVEWIKKFPDNQTSHLSLEDYDSDDEEVECIIRRAEQEDTGGRSPSNVEGALLQFPTGGQRSAGSSTSPQPSMPEAMLAAAASPEVELPAVNGHSSEFPVNVSPAYATPSPVSQLSDLSEPSTQASPSPSLPLGSPLLGSTHAYPPETHFTPIPSPSSMISDGEGGEPKPKHQPQQHSTRITPTIITTTAAAAANTQLRPSLCIPGASRTPSLSPLPADITPEELVFEIGHLDGLIFEARSREPTPSRSPVPPVLSSDELAFDIGNMGGLILGPPSRSVSPIPPPSPAPLSSSGPPSSLGSGSSWVVIDPNGQTSSSTTAAASTTAANNNE